MKKSQIIGAVLVAVVVAGASFFAGDAYAKMGAGMRGQFMGQFGQGNFRAGMGARGAGGISAGQVLSVGGGTLTLKMQNGSTQIVLMGTSTQVLKAVAGSVSDLTAGTNIVVMGSPNSDGSLTAQSIQVRPASAPRQP